MGRAGFFLSLFAVLMIGGGCVLFSEPYIEPAEYDLAAPGPEVVPEPVAVPVEFGVFRNLSGSDRRFLVRIDGDRLQSDEYNRWLLIPEQLIVRHLYEALPGSADCGTPVRINAVIYRFEFDRNRQEAVFCARFTLRRAATEVQVDTAVRTPMADASPEAAVAAMSSCLAKAAAELRTAIAGNWGEEK